MAAPPTEAAAAARSAARAILREARFHEPPVPHPFSGALKTLDHALGSVFGGGGNSTIGPIEIGDPWLIALLVVVVGVIAFIVARMGVRRRVSEAGTKARRGRVGVDASAIRQAADAAERAGDFGRAVRLRFEAGVASLAERGAIPRPTALRAAQIRSHLRSPLFDALNGEFEQVAYGGRNAGPDTAERARGHWQELLDEVGS